MMTFEEILEHLRFEWHAEHAAQVKNVEQFGFQLKEVPQSFYDYVVKRGISRHKLSGHGYSRFDLDGERKDNQ